ncbi:MAG: hypothetical protein ABJB66_02730 [Gemmatimonadaceae bacterium]
MPPTISSAGDLGAMVVVAVAVSFERLSRNAVRAARAVGIVTVGVGVCLALRAVVLVKLMPTASGNSA